MPRRILAIPIVVVLAMLAAWLLIPTVKNLLTPSSVVDNIGRLRLGMAPDEVRAALGPPAVRGLGSWTYGQPGELADHGVTIFFDADSRVSG